MNLNFFQLAKNDSFGAISSLTQIPETTITRIFWKTIQMYFQNLLEIPNIPEDCDIDALYQDLWDDLDPFYKGIFGAFKDPSGQFIYGSENLKKNHLFSL